MHRSDLRDFLSFAGFVFGFFVALVLMFSPFVLIGILLTIADNK